MPPLIAVVPVLEFCVNDVALTVDEKVVVPVPVKEILPSPCAPPTAPVKVMLPEPTLTVSALAVVLSLLTVLLKDMALLVVARVVSAESVTAPVYVCVPVVVTLPVRMVPDAWVEVVAKLVNAVLLPTVLLKVMLPVPAVMVSALAPFTVLLNETALLVVAKVVAAAKVTGPV